MPGGGGGGTTTSIQDIPPSFRPAFNQLFNSAFGAARQASGQDPFGFGGIGGQQQPSPLFFDQTPLQMLEGLGGGFGGQGGFGQGGGLGGIGGGFGGFGGFGQQGQQQGGFQPQAAGPAAPGPVGQPQQNLGFAQTPGVNQRSAAQQQFGGQQQAAFGLTGDQQDAFERVFGPITQFTGPGVDAEGEATPGIPARQGAPQAGPNPFPGSDVPGNPNFGAIQSNTQASKGIPLAGGPPIIGQAFPGRFTAPSSPLELESLALREGVGRQAFNAGAPLGNLAQFTAGGGFLSPESNPFLQANIEASLRPAVRNFQESALPAFESQAINSGAFKGSSARDFAANTVAQDFGQTLADTAGKIGFQNFQGERGFQQNAGNLLNQAFGLQQLSPELLGQAGLGQRNLAQRGLDEQLLQFTESQQAPFRPLNQLGGLIHGTNIGNVSSTTVPQNSAVGQGIASAFGGGAAGGSLANAAGFGNTGQAVGAGAGSIAGLLSQLLS